MVRLYRSTCWLLAAAVFGIAAATQGLQTNAILHHPRALIKNRLQSCLIQAGVEIVAADISEADLYFQASASDNVVFHYNPTVIAYPKSPAQVQQAVLCASANSNAPIAARSGGHSFAGYGSGGMDGSIVIDLANLNHVKSYPDQGTVDVGPGARLGDVVKGLWNQQDAHRAMSTGTCAAVGVGGLSLCGGFGPMSRKWGLTTDSILEADLILANGTMVTVSESQHQDLFWALRGSGSFFGIVTRFLFQSHDASSPLTSFEFRWTPSISSADAAVAVMSAIQDFSLQPDLSNDLGFHIQLRRPSNSDPQPIANRPITIEMKGIFFGSTEEWSTLRAKLMDSLLSRSAPKPDRQSNSRRSYLQLMEDWDDFSQGGEKLDTAAIHKHHNNFVMKSSLTLERNKGFADQALRPLFQHLWDTSLSAGQQAPLANGKTTFWGWNIYFELFGGGSPVYSQPKAKQLSSFPNRDGLWLIQISAGTLAREELAHSGHAYASQLDTLINAAIENSGLGRGGYSCYADAELKEEDWRRLYYGSSIARLEDIKMQVDPSNLFRNPQTLGSRQQIQARRKTYQDRQAPASSSPSLRWSRL